MSWSCSQPNWLTALCNTIIYKWQRYNIPCTTCHLKQSYGRIEDAAQETRNFHTQSKDEHDMTTMGETNLTRPYWCVPTRIQKVFLTNIRSWVHCPDRAWLHGVPVWWQRWIHYNELLWLCDIKNVTHSTTQENIFKGCRDAKEHILPETKTTRFSCWRQQACPQFLITCPRNQSTPGFASQRKAKNLNAIL